MLTLLYSDYFFYVELLYLIITIAVAIRIIYDTDSISKTLAYLLLVIFIPIFGIIFYFLFGVNYRKRKMYSKKLKVNDDYMERLIHRVTDVAMDCELHENLVVNENRSIINMLSNNLLGAGPLLSNNQVDLLKNGERFFPRLLADLRAAKHHIHLEYYIYENNSIGQEIADILIAKVKEGVEVRFIYDDFGSKSIRKNMVKRLQKNGVECYPFNEVILIAFANRMNYRNHRKIVVIDGNIGYTGGINISDRYDNNRKEAADYFWRDTHVRIYGNGVYGLQYVFLADWNFCSKQNLAFTREYFPKVLEIAEHNLPLQVISSGPDSDVPSILYSVLKAIETAKSEVLITTPYYIPDESLQLAIKMAVLSGKKVKLLLPGITDSYIVKWASESYFQELLEFGVEIYLYKKGFIHAKTFVTDSGLCSIGTCNLDHRSFDLNFEVNVVIYDDKLAAEMRQMFFEDCENALKLELDRWEKRSRWHRLKNRLIRLFSPLL